MPTIRPAFWSTIAAVLSIGTVMACQPSGEAAESSGATTVRVPAAPATRTLDAYKQFSIATTETISSRTAKPGDPFRATVVANVLNDAGRVAIPAGSAVSGTITDVQSAPNPSSPGSLTLAVNSVTVRGKTYPLDARIESLATERHGRGISGGDAARVGAGAAAGAIIGQVIGKNTKGTVIGAVVGAAVGAGYAAVTKDGDIVLPAGTHVVLTLTKRLSVSAS
jgi:hypothetical protein